MNLNLKVQNFSNLAQKHPDFKRGQCLTIYISFIGQNSDQMKKSTKFAMFHLWKRFIFKFPSVPVNK